MHWLDDVHSAVAWANSLKTHLSKFRHLSYLVLLAVMVTLMGGLMLFLVDPNVKSLQDGVWSVWVTLTHVEFGDVVPVSFLGRLLMAGLIFLGVVFFSLFMALVSIALIGRNMDALDQKTVVSHDEKDRILDELARLHQWMDALEKLLSSEDDGK
ncbi:potassium channel family protein [Methylobacter sp. BlB1]|uniref:potassium channel family protein n=1 Tax=Methylobacter sp. BlB1 TaxID=2785914 RepID=UPI00189347E5|nr:potassium channel family protein [Methylobacter sp. BlB1]MBF6649959.1 two pore domain potassium channel family protein [Methylobacter sp. BlB1]